MIKSKKSQMLRNATLVLIIFLVAAFLLIKFQTVFLGVLGSEIDDEACRLSALAQAQTKGVLTGGKSPVNLDCPRHHITFFPDRVEKDGDRIPLRIEGQDLLDNEFDNLNDNIVNQVVAEEMRQCWRKMGEGEINVFENDLLSTRKTVCLICSEIDFDDEVTPQIFSGLPEYLDNEIPTSIQDEERTYNEILLKSYSYQIDLWPIPFPWYGDESVRLWDEESIFNTNKEYLVFFLGFKGNEIGGQVDWYYTYVSEIGQIGDSCFIVYN